MKQEGVIRVSMVLAITLFYGHGIHGRTRKDFKNIKISCEHRRPGADGAYYYVSLVGCAMRTVVIATEARGHS